MREDAATRPWRLPALLGLALVATLPTHAVAGIVDLAQEPLYTTTSSSVKPNLMFILDNSGSMNDDYLPDEASGTSTHGYWSAQCNGVAYNPATTYTVPVDANGDPKTAPSFTAACDNGFSGSCSVNLSNKYYYKYVGSQTPLSYQYDTNGVITSSTFYKECKTAATTSPTTTIKVSGSSSAVVSGITVNGVQIMSGATTASSSSGTVAAYIAAKITQNGYSATYSGSTVTVSGPASAAGYTPVVSCSGCGMSFTTAAFPPFVKVTVSNTSGIGGTDERQNYANWYSYYRKRLLMMKTATGLAFKKIGSNYRVGFSTISYTGTDSNNAGFLAINDFASGSGEQKEKFYSKLYGASGSSWTPLRGALAKAGRIYAGKLGADPMQYSCQQNFTLLSTDGYWNTPDETASYGPFGLDGSTAVGQRDGGSTPRPLNDGETTTVTQTTPTVTTSVVTTPRTVLTRSTRTDATTTVTTQRRTHTYTRTRLTSSSSDACGGSTNTRRRIYTGTTTETVTTTTTSSQPYQVDTTTAYSDVATTTTTSTRTVVTTNGVVTSDTTAVTTNGPDTVSTVTSGPTSATTALGSPTSATVGPTTTVSPAAPTSTSWFTSSPTSDSCVTTTSNSDTYALTGSSAWTTTTSGPTTTTGTATVSAGYPQTTLGEASTVVSGPTQGATTSNTSTVVGHPNTLADVAMYYYETDLRNPGNCTSGSSGANLCPTDSNGVYAPNVPGSGDDNNVKPHMTTFTLGLGINGLLNYASSYAKDTSGDFYSIRTGGKDWPDPDTSASSPYAGTGSSVIERVDDLWHAAVNGRGAYFSAKNPDSLVTSLNAALAGMSTRLGYGTSAATSNLAPILGDNSLFVASFTTAQWTGNLVAESIDIDTGTINPTAAWCVENVAADTSNGIPACTGTLAGQVGAASDSRTIWFNKAGTLTAFAYDNLPAKLQAYFDTTQLSQYSATYSADDKTAATGATLVDFLRGQTQFESQDGATARLYRDRKATLGDIVDTPPLFVGKPSFEYNDLGYNAWKSATAQQTRGATVFVGANDGMLHAFNATTGVERWAFVPSPVIPELWRLADANYTANHHNYVDGRLTYFDVCVKDCSDAAKADWRTLLIGGLGSGGRGYYALDVTDPTVPKLLWEFTSLNDADLGYSFGNPLAVKKADGTWVVLLTSGYDNVRINAADPGPYDADGSGRGYLFILNPLTGAVLDKIEAKDGATLVGDKTTPSGLGRIASWADTPTLDATAVYVYGGDLQGNLWRFDINTQAVVRLASFTDANAHAQPITTRPELAKVNGHRIIYVSTGKYLERADLQSENFRTQSLYALADTGVTVASPRTTMVRQTLTSNKPNRTVTTNPVTISPPTVNGWYVDFPDNGELSNIDMTLAQGTLLVPTNVPTNGVCEAGGYSWYNYFNYKTGSYVPGATTAAKWAGNDLTTGHNIIWIKGQPVVVRTGSGTAPRLLPGVPFNPGGVSGVIGHRVSWREIIRK